MSILSDIIGFFSNRPSSAAQRVASGLSSVESDVERAVDEVAVELVNEFVAKIPLIGQVSQAAVDRLVTSAINALFVKLSPAGQSAVGATLAPKPSS